MASTRLPGKPLAAIAGKPMVRWVYEAACASGAERVVVATDHADVASAAALFGAEVCMTSAAHPSGTDRLAEVVRVLAIPDDTLVVNLQGDEPLMPPSLIAGLATALGDRPDRFMATAREALSDPADLRNPDVVKVVVDQTNDALYFSRALIPWPREPDPRGGLLSAAWYRHIGLYAYRAGFLQQFVAWGPCALEQIEMLEQLRALWRGVKIHVVTASHPVPGGVDSPADLQRVQRAMGALD